MSMKTLTKVVKNIYNIHIFIYTKEEQINERKFNIKGSCKQLLDTYKKQ